MSPWYNKGFLAFVPAFWEGGSKSSEFPGDRSIFVIHDGPLGPSLGLQRRRLRMGAGPAGKTKPVIRGLGLRPTGHQTPGGWGWRLNSIHPASVVSSGCRGAVELPGWWMHANVLEGRFSEFGTLPGLALAPLRLAGPHSHPL